VHLNASSTPANQRLQETSRLFGTPEKRAAFNERNAPLCRSASIARARSAAFTRRESVSKVLMANMLMRASASDVITDADTPTNEKSRVPATRTHRQPSFRLVSSGNDCPLQKMLREKKAACASKGKRALE
jgi:hypothetical protein